MSFIKRELNRISGALRDSRHEENRDALYAAQQALSWAQDPNSFRTPYGTIMGIREGSEDCSDPHHQLQS